MILEPFCSQNAARDPPGHLWETSCFLDKSVFKKAPPGPAPGRGPGAIWPCRRMFREGPRFCAKQRKKGENDAHVRFRHAGAGLVTPGVARKAILTSPGALFGSRFWYLSSHVASRRPPF